MKQIPKTIVLVHDYPSLNGGGVVHLNNDLAKFLHQQGRRVAIVTPDHTTNLLKLIQESDTILISISSKLRAIAQQAIAMARIYHKPYSVWLHTKLPKNYLHSEHGRKMGLVIADDLCQSFICVSKNVELDVVTTFGLSPKITTVYPAVYTAQRFEFKSSSKCSTDILFAGRLAKEKGADIFIKAFAKLLQKRPETTATIIGDGEEKKPLVALATKLGIMRSLRFLPHCERTDLFTHIINCRVFSIASRTESFCITLAEALALGATTVAPNIGGPAEIHSLGRFGYLFKPEDSGSLARTFEIALRKKTTSTLSQKLFAMRHFDATKQFNILSNLL